MTSFTSVAPPLSQARGHLQVPFNRSSQCTGKNQGGAERNIYNKVKRNFHKTLSPASVYKIALPSKSRTFLRYQTVFA
jgi:hypothetical protein